MCKIILRNDIETDREMKTKIETKTKFERRLHRNIGLDYIACFLQNLNMQNCIWVLYLSYCGLNLGQIGILEGVYHITSMIFEIPSGAVADLLGRKKSMIISRVLVAISCMLMLLSRNIWLFALSFFIQALGNNFNSGSEEALVYDSMKAMGKEEHYIGVNGKLNVIIEVSQGLATVLGGILAEQSFMYCYGASLVIAVCALLPVFLMVEAPFEKEEKKETGIIKKFADHFRVSYKILKSNKRILKVIVFFQGVFTAQTILFFYSQQYFFDMGYNKIWISCFMLLFSVMSCAGALLSERIYAKYGNSITVMASLVIAISIGIFLFQNIIVSLAGFAFAGFFNSLLYPIQSGMLNKMIPSEQRATLISINSMFFSIGMIIIFPIAGLLADYFGLGRIFAGISVILVLFVLILGKRLGETRK